MANKFKCKDCRHSFVLSNENEAVCPKCKSDNIKPQSNTISIIAKFILFIIMAAIGYFTTDFILKKDNKELVQDNIPEIEETVIEKNTIEEVTVMADDSTASVSEQSAETIIEIPLEPIDNAVFTISDMILKQEGFSFIVKCGNIPNDYLVDQYRLFLNEDDTEPFIVAEANGQFISDKYAAENGRYFVQALFINNNHTTLEPIEGIIKPATPAKEVKPTRMEKSELQSKIDKSIANTNGGHADNQWYKGRDKRISNKVKITLRAENNVDQKEQTFTGSQAMLKHAQAKKVKITVLSVSYDNDVIDAFEIATSK